MALVVSLLAVFGSCSAIPLALEPRIVNGIPIDAAAYPWMVSLRAELNLTALAGVPYYANHTFCGGSLIQLSPPVVLTAAHCVDTFEEDDDGMPLLIEGNSSYTATLYADINRTYPNNQTMGDSYQSLSFSVSMIYIHGKWNTSNLINGYDIALIIFDDNDTSLDFSEDDLPSLDSAQLDDEVACCDDGETLKAIGYGLDSDNGTGTETLEYTELSFVTSDDCEAVIQDITNISDFSFGGEQFVCVLGNDTDLCQGDSGGPVFTMDGDDPTIHGVASFVIFGCNSGHPSVYTSSGHFIDWIDDTINYVVYGISASPTVATTASPDSDEGDDAMGLLSHNAVYAALFAAAVLHF